MAVAAAQDTTACYPTALVVAPAAQQGNKGPAIAPNWWEELVPQGLFCRALLPPACPHTCGLPILGQDFLPAVVGPHVVPVSPFLQPTLVPLKSSPALQHMDCFTPKLCIIHKLSSKRSCPRATLQFLVHSAEHQWQVCPGLLSSVSSLCRQV